MHKKYKRILLKLSGEALMGNSNFGISADAIHNYVNEVITLHKQHIQVGIVVGGGNIFRGMESDGIGITKITGDAMGMLATIMNALALKDVFRKSGMEAVVQTSTSMPMIAEVFNRDSAVSHLENGRVVIFAGGTGNPFFTTDSAASLRAIEVDADILIKATNVDGVYDSDPRKNSDAKKYDTISFKECIDQKLRVMDLTAFVLCMENSMPIAVLNLHQSGNLVKFFAGEKIGTLIN
ncbi:MAG: UMP kinase [Ignavibacteria bacterium]|jgi:uridylate kinase|nr:UMP kinase [Ignavibacteria bacterium]